MNVPNSRQDFIDTWLTEAPEGVGSFETFDALEYQIRDFIKHGVAVKDLDNNLKKIELSQSVIYWYEDQHKNIILASALAKSPQALVVEMTGKNPRYKNKPPYASDLYHVVLQDNKTHSIRLLSDRALSDEGKKLWDRMFQKGDSVSVYDRENPGRTFKTFDSQAEMDSYFKHDDTDFRRYQYVLSAPGEMLAETRSFFHLRRFRELTRRLL